MIRVQIVDDSIVAQEFLNYIFCNDPEIQVVGIAKNGEEAIKLVERNKPDVITMDINMPGIDGFETTRKIMETFPTPIVIVSASRNTKEVSTIFKAIEAGALTAIDRPVSINHPDFQRTSQELVTTVKLMSEVKVIKRFPAHNHNKFEDFTNGIKVSEFKSGSKTIKTVVIGASTGGPIAIQKILSLIPKDFPVPILIVQHISDGFIQGFADWLNSTTGFNVKVAFNGEILKSGNAYIAPDGYNLAVEKNGQKIQCVPYEDHQNISSVSILFESVASVFGNEVIAILLTGMGHDGAKELKLLKDLGAVTIAQDKESCIVFGMPAEAIKLDGATYVLPPEKIATLLNSLIVVENSISVINCQR